MGFALIKQWLLIWASWLTTFHHFENIPLLHLLNIQFLKWYFWLIVWSFSSSSEILPPTLLNYPSVLFGNFSDLLTKSWVPFLPTCLLTSRDHEDHRCMLIQIIFMYKLFICRDACLRHSVQIQRFHCIFVVMYSELIYVIMSFSTKPL